MHLQAQTLRDVVDHLAGYRDDLDYLPDFNGEEVEEQIKLLHDVMDERIHSASEAIEVVNDYFQEKPAAKKTVESKTQPVRQELIASAAVGGKVQ